MHNEDIDLKEETDARGFRLLSLSGKGRDNKAKSENDGEPDPPHGTPR